MCDIRKIDGKFFDVFVNQLFNYSKQINFIFLLLSIVLKQVASLSRFVNAIQVNYVCLQFGDRDPILIVAPKHGERMHINVSEDLQKLGVSWAFSIDPNDSAYKGVRITNELCKKLRTRDENHTESNVTLDSKSSDSSSTHESNSQSNYSNSVDTVESVFKSEHL